MIFYAVEDRNGNLLGTEFGPFIFAEETTVKNLREGETVVKVKIEREKACWCDERGDGPCPLHARENALQDRALFAEANLSTLLSAVEPIERIVSQTYSEIVKSESTELVIEWADGSSTPVMAGPQLFAIVTVAAGIRGGKG